MASPYSVFSASNRRRAHRYHLRARRACATQACGWRMTRNTAEDDVPRGAVCALARKTRRKQHAWRPRISSRYRLLTAPHALLPLHHKAAGCACSLITPRCASSCLPRAPPAPFTHTCVTCTLQRRRDSTPCLLPLSTRFMRAEPGQSFLIPLLPGEQTSPLSSLPRLSSSTAWRGMYRGERRMAAMAVNRLSSVS